MHETTPYSPTVEQAQAFARNWIESWNSHDLDRILAHYSEDFSMRSPLIRDRGLDPSGVLQGKAAVRAYWAKGLEATPPLRFELLDVFVGASSVAIAYLSVGRGMVTEVVVFNGTGLVISGNALYGP